MKYLNDNKAEINATDNEGQTSFHISATRGNLECCKFLIDNKADVNATDKESTLHFTYQLRKVILNAVNI